MFAVSVTFVLKPDLVPAFTAQVCHNAEMSLKVEPGCHRFDVCTDAARPNEVMLYELYDDAAAFEVHLASTHYKVFNAAVADMVRSKVVQTYAVVREGGAP